jgi:cytochrome c
MSPFRSFAITTLLASALVTSPAILADQAMAQAKGCLACHQVENKVVGPAFKDVAAKYKDDAGAADMLAAKVKSGGVGTWGQIPMPPQTTVSDDEIKALVAWVLSL